MSIRKSLAISLSSNYVKLVLGIISSMILARLLTPEDFGIYSVAFSVANFAYMFRNIGINQYLIQAEEVTPSKMSSAFGVTLLLSWSLGLLLAGLSGPLSRLYGNEGIAEVLWYLSFNFYIIPFGAVPSALLRRNMLFGKVATIELASAFVGFIVGISAAFAGKGYMSIVWSSNASTITLVVLSMRHRPDNMPFFPAFTEWRDILKFGLNVGIADFTLQSGNSLTELLIGKIQNLAAVGIYSRAFGAIGLFGQLFAYSISPVILPYLSEARRNKGDVVAIFAKILSFMTIVAMPFYAAMYCVAHDFIVVLFGDQWLESVPILKIMCIFMPFSTLTMHLDQLYISAGNTKHVLRIQLVSQTARIASLAALVHFELAWAAFAIGVLAMFRLAYGISTSPEFRNALRVGSRPILTAFLVGLSLVLIHSIYSNLVVGLNPLVNLIVFGIITGVFWLLAVYGSKHAITEEINSLVSNVLERVSKKG